MEEWKKIPGFSRYSASTAGRIRLDVPHWGRQPRVLKPKVHQSYFRVHVAHDWGFSARIPVHRLVSLAFHGEPPFLGAFVLHGDGNHFNNAPANLRYGTARENTADSDVHGVLCRGEAHPDAKLSATQVMEVVTRLRSGEKQTDIAASYGITQSTVSLIARGKKWRHVTGGVVPHRQSRRAA